MAFRFRFPWSLVLAPLGYAGVAVVFAYALLTDYHGHLWLRAALDCAGAALLGVIAWRYSERLSDFVNLHTAPTLRLGLSGTLGIALATLWTALFSEFAAGTASWWPHLAATALFLAVALPPTLALVTLLTIVETAFAARRGGSAMLEAIRPLLRHAAVAVVVAAALGYVAVMLPDAADRVALAIAPDAPRSSGWSEREQRLFLRVAQGWDCEVLVVPPEAPTPSLDRPARSMIARYLSAELARRSGMCVADPTLVARALGTQARAYDSRKVESLADALSARVLVRTEIRMDPARPAYVLVLRVVRRTAAGSAWSAAEEVQWGPIVFSDELPPEAAFARVTSEAADVLGLELQTASEEAGSGHDEPPLELSLTGLLVQSNDPVRNARALQLLAAAYHASDLAGEHLWERSLIALATLRAEDQQARILRARAALHLHRRPYALVLLDGLESPEAQAVRALADGNLAPAAQRESEIADAAGKLTLRLEVESLRHQYARTAGAPLRRKQVLDSYPGLASLLYVPFSAGLPQQWEPIVAAQLEQLSGEGIAPALAGAALPASRSLLHAVGIGSAAGDIESGYAPTWQTRAGQWRAQQAYDRLAEWDAFDAVHAANRTAVLLQARGLGHAGDVERQIAALMIDFPGYPALQAVLADALAHAPAAPQPPPVAAERARRLARDVALAEDGETEIKRDLRQRVASLVPVEPADEPPRPRSTGAAGQSAANDAGDATRLERYAQSDFDVLRAAIAQVEGAGDAQRAVLLEQQALVRFRGSPAREAFLLARAQSRRDLPAVQRVWTERIQEDAAEWSHYRSLASVHLRARDAAQAQRLMLAFPAFASDASAQAAPAALSGGEMLLLAGETELARPLLLIAAQPGAEVKAGVPQLRARALLAQLEGDWKAAREVWAALHDGHQDERALTQAAALSFLLGHSEEGWRAFYEASKRFEDTGPWQAAAAGHRLEGTKPDEVIAFAKRWKSLSGQARVETRLRGRFLFDMLMVDRAPTDWAVEAMVQLAGEKDPVLAAHVHGYAAFKRGRYEQVLEYLLPLQQSGKADPAALPWVALALAQSGRAAEVAALLPSADTASPAAFHALLASAYASGSAGAVDVTLDRLWDAFLTMPPAPSAAAPLVPAGYALLETCERLHALTGEQRYRDLLLDLARRQQRAWPYAWAYAFEARHAASPEEREHALGMALHLDAQSEHVRDFAPNQRQRAAERFATSNPFKRG